MLPVSAREAPAQCFNCCTKLHGPELLGALREIKWLHDLDTSGDAGIGLWIDP